MQILYLILLAQIIQASWFCCHNNFAVNPAAVIFSSTTTTTTTADVCSICFDVSPTYSLSCGHVFHKECVLSWFQQSRTECPMCREPVIIPLMDAIMTKSTRVVNDSLRVMLDTLEPETAIEQLYSGAKEAIKANHFNIFNLIFRKIPIERRGNSLHFIIASIPTIHYSFLHAFVDFDFSSVDASGNTVIHVAAGCRSFFLFDLLHLHQGAMNNINSINSDNETPLDHIALKVLYFDPWHYRYVRLLKRKGASFSEKHYLLNIFYRS